MSQNWCQWKHEVFGLTSATAGIQQCPAFDLIPHSKSAQLGLEVRSWGFLIMSHANRLIEMTTSHCCRVLCSHLHSSEQIQLTSQVLNTLPLPDVESRIWHFMPWFEAYLTLTRPLFSAFSLTKTSPHSLSPKGLVLVYRLPFYRL